MICMLMRSLNLEKTSVRTSSDIGRGAATKNSLALHCGEFDKGCCPGRATSVYGQVPVVNL